MSPLHQEKMRVAAPPEMVQQWILAPEKVLEYAPGPVDCGLFRPGEQVWIRLKTGVTLLEKVHEESTDNRTTVRVTASTLKRNPTSVTEIESNRLMTFMKTGTSLALIPGHRYRRPGGISPSTRCAGCPLAG